MPALTFVSSLSSVTSLSSSAQVSESVVLDNAAPAYTGYGESKYVAERLLNEASKQIPGLSTTILRIGQIAGPVEYNSIWPAREWLPSLIVSSKSIDALPSDLGRMNDVDWIPVDTLADCISEVVLSGTVLVKKSAYDHPRDSQGGECKTLTGHWTINGGEQQSAGNESHCKVYHVLNPNVVSWQSLLPAVQEQTGITRIKPLRDWIELVQEGPDVDQGPTTPAEAGGINPAKKILQFYQALQLSRKADTDSADPPDTIESQSGGNTQSGALDDGGPVSVRPFQLENMAGASSTFRSLDPVSSAWLAKWIDGWL
jgi:hypothetical protein